MLQVRFAEVNRTALQPSWALFTIVRQPAARLGRPCRRRSSSAAPAFDDEHGGLVFSDFLNIFFFNAGRLRRGHQGAAADRGSSRASPSRT